MHACIRVRGTSVTFYRTLWRFFMLLQSNFFTISFPPMLSDSLSGHSRAVEVYPLSSLRCVVLEILTPYLLSCPRSPVCKALMPRAESQWFESYPGQLFSLKKGVIELCALPCNNLIDNTSLSCSSSSHLIIYLHHIFS